MAKNQIEESVQYFYAKRRKYISNDNKNNVFAEAYAMDISAKFQFYRPYNFWVVSLQANLAFWLPIRQPNKLRGLDKNYIFGRGPLIKNFWKTFVILSAMG